MRLGCDAILDGLGRVSRCSLEGRAAMSLDLSAVEKGLRPMAPATALSSLRLVSVHHELQAAGSSPAACPARLLPATFTTNRRMQAAPSRQFQIHCQIFSWAAARCARLLPATYGC